MVHKEVFWDFYLANRADVDRILEKTIAVYNRDGWDPRDLLHDTFVRLATPAQGVGKPGTDFLHKWDPKKSALETYFISQVNSNVKHVLEAKAYAPKWWKGNGVTHRWHRVEAEGINGVRSSDEEWGGSRMAGEPQSDYDLEAEYIAKETLSRTTEALCPQNRAVLKDMFSGYNAEEMAKARGAMVMDVQNQVYTVRFTVKTTFGVAKKRTARKAKSIISVIPGKSTRDMPTPRNGNGHEPMRKRSLTDAEKGKIRSYFMSLDGKVTDDDCLLIRLALPDDVTIFQVTGVIVNLHRLVAQGQIKLRDYEGYQALRVKQRSKYAGPAAADYAAAEAARLNKGEKQNVHA